MNALKKSIAGLLVLSIIWISSPGASIGNATTLFTLADIAPISRHEPKIKSTPEQDIPLSTAEEGEKKGISKWAWLGLGALAVGVAALALGGGGGGGDGEPPPEGTGSFTGNW